MEISVVVYMHAHIVYVHGEGGGGDPSSPASAIPEINQ